MPDGTTQLIGLDKVMRNLQKEVNKFAERTQVGMIAAGEFVQAESQDRTPVDKGTLRASARTTWAKASDDLSVAVSYSTYYAIYVHERKATHEVGDWKYLERAVTENLERILQIIYRRSKLT